MGFNRHAMVELVNVHIFKASGAYRQPTELLKSLVRASAATGNCEGDT